MVAKGAGEGRIGSLGLADANCYIWFAHSVAGSGVGCAKCLTGAQFKRVSKNSVIASISLGHHNKIPQTGCLQQQKFDFTVPPPFYPMYVRVKSLQLCPTL